MSVRANTVNSDGTGTSKVSGGNVATGSTFVTTFPRPSGQTITVSKAIQGCSVGDSVERDSDGGFWDITAGLPVPCDATSIGADDMRST